MANDGNAAEVFKEVCSGGVTPTTLVGTRIIRGGDMVAIRKALANQKDW